MGILSSKALSLSQKVPATPFFRVPVSLLFVYATFARQIAVRPVILFSVHWPVWLTTAHHRAVSENGCTAKMTLAVDAP